MTNQKFIEDNKIPFSKVLKYWANVGHLEEWLLREKKPIFSVGDIIYNRAERLIRKVTHVGKRYYITECYDDCGKNSVLDDSTYATLTMNDPEMKTFIDGHSGEIHYDTIYNYEIQFEKIGVSV